MITIQAILNTLALIPILAIVIGILWGLSIEIYNSVRNIYLDNLVNDSEHAIKP